MSHQEIFDAVAQRIVPGHAVVISLEYRAPRHEAGERTISAVARSHEMEALGMRQRRAVEALHSHGNGHRDGLRETLTP